MTDTLEHIPKVLEVLKGAREKVLIRPWENNGRQYVSVAVQVLGEDGEYYFQRGRSFALKPDEARALSSALSAMAAAIDGSPQDPTPTEQSRDEE